MGAGDGEQLIPGAFDPRFARFFGWYVKRLFRRRFHAVRLVAGDVEALRALDAHPGPVIVAMTHPSWWDPLIPVLIGRLLLPSRSACGPMEADQLRRFRLFRRLGVFGIDPESRSSLQAMVAYLDELFRTTTRPTLYLTPQGRFTDPREPIRIRPGAASVAARHPEARCVALALEYVFWNDQRPEACMAAAECHPPGRTRTAWQRALTSTLQAQADRLAALVRERDPSAFESLIGGEEARIHPVYDAWLRVTGRHGAIRGRSQQPAGSEQP